MTDQPPGHQPPGYPHTSAYTPSGGFPASSGGFPAQSGGFPAQTGGFPTQTGGFPAAPPPKRGPAVPVLSALVVLFLAAAGVMVFLWLGAKDDAAAETAALDKVQSGNVEHLRARDAALSEGEGLVKDIGTLEGEIVELRKCADPARDALDAAVADDDAKLADAVDAMISNCRG